MTSRVYSTKRLITVLAMVLLAVAVLLPQKPAFQQLLRYEIISSPGCCGRKVL